MTCIVLFHLSSLKFLNLLQKNSIIHLIKLVLFKSVSFPYISVLFSIVNDWKNKLFCLQLFSQILVRFELVWIRSIFVIYYVTIAKPEVFIKIHWHLLFIWKFLVKHNISFCMHILQYIIFIQQVNGKNNYNLVDRKE